MDATFIDAISQLISGMGFPIAISCYLLWYNNKQTEIHKAETDRLAEALNNNTRVMIRLCERLGVDGDE